MKSREQEIANKIILEHTTTKNKSGVYFGWSDSYSLEKLNYYLEPYNLKAWIPDLMNYDSEVFWSCLKKE